MASPKVLEEWCRLTCAGYSSVEVKDWSSSFKSGLPFCAIIHKHRPELIDFSSLSKDSAYENNKMAFEVAETKLGVPILLDAGEIASVLEPDRLAVITCLFQFYFLFNRKSIDLDSLKSLYDISDSSAKSTQNSKSLTHLESTGNFSSIDTKPRVSCNLCLKPLHLIQRRVVDGKIYHRKCFRCRRCHLSLLPGTYSKGNTVNSLICSHHVKPHRESASKQTCDYLSLSGLAVSSVPHYPEETEPPDQQVCKEAEICSSVGLYSVVKKTLTQLSDSDENGCNDEKHEASIAPGDTENILGGGPERGRGPVPAPRMTSYGTPSSPNMSTSGTQGTSDKTTVSAPVVTYRGSSPTRGSCRVRTNHPWLKIIHPGPWTQLPPAPPLAHPLRSKSVSSLSGVWYKPRTVAPNPFDEEKNNKATAQKLTENVGVTSQKSDVNDVVLEEEKDTVNNDLAQSSVSASCVEELEVQAQSHPEAVMGALSDEKIEEEPCPTQTGNEDSTLKCDSTVELPSHNPAFPGFPVIKRKVQTEPSSSSEDLQQEIGQVANHLEALEEKGVELEGNIRLCTNNKEEEKLLMDWFSLVYQKHILERKDKELVYLIKQRELEKSQEDVEYGLRCLLNRPEGEWSEQDRRQEQQLMEELLHIIDQRNQIISHLDQDVQREREYDASWETMVNNRDVQKCELKELKKSKATFKTTSVFKILNKKTEGKRGNKS